MSRIGYLLTRNHDVIKQYLHFRLNDFERPPPPENIWNDKKAVEKHRNKVHSDIYRKRILKSVLGPA